MVTKKTAKKTAKKTLALQSGTLSDGDKNKPWVENYPPLRDWLRKHDAYCQWQLPLGSHENPTSYVECWGFPKGGQCVVVVRENRHGWEILTPEGSNRIDAALADAEKRLKLAPISDAKPDST